MSARNPSDKPVSLSDLSARLDRNRLSVRGGFHPLPGDAVPRGGALGDPETLVLVGVVGRRLWPAFETSQGEGENPLDGWTKQVVGEVATAFGGVPLYPNDKPFWPFQQWAQRCEPVFPSPLGLLIHPEFGLWHAYRAAILFSERIELPSPSTAPSPCQSCADKPCLTGCPVDAFTPNGYDVARCSQHLRSDAGSLCLTGGCQARNACPVGTSHRYDKPQMRFHMAAFNRSMNGQA